MGVEMILRMVILLLSAALLTPRSARADSRELAEIYAELKVATVEYHALLRNVPSEFDEVLEIERLRRRADAMGLAPLEIRPVSEAVRLSLGNGSPSDLEVRRLELSGRDAYQSIDHFLQITGQIARATSLEFFKINPASEGRIRYSIRIAFAVYAPRPRPDESAGDVITAAREELARMKGELSLLRKYVETGPGDEVRNSLAILQRELEKHPLTLHEAAFDDGGVTLRGMLIGSATREALDAALRSAGLEVIGSDALPLGRCRAFEIVARPLAGERAPEVVLGNGIFEMRNEAICADRPEPLQIVLPGSAPGELPLLRLRAADLDGVFHALNELIGGGFVVDSALDMRVSVDIPGTANVEDIFESIASLGLAIGPGPIRTVTAASAGSVSAEMRPNVPGELVSFSFKDIAVSDVLCLIGSVAEREVLAPPDLEGRVSIYATDVSLGDLVEAILAANGLVSKNTAEGMVFTRTAGAEAEGADPCEALSPSSRLRPSELVHDIRAADLELVGLAFFETPKAYIYGLARRPMFLEAGAELNDATLSAIDHDGIVLTRRDGSEMRVPLAPVKRSAR